MILDEIQTNALIKFLDLASAHFEALATEPWLSTSARESARRSLGHLEGIRAIVTGSEAAVTDRHQVH